MIKFFRSIRQNLLQQGKIANYLKYSIEEILLLVIGKSSPFRDSIWVEEISKSSIHRAFRYGI